MSSPVIAILLATALQCPDGAPPPCVAARTPASLSVAVLTLESRSADDDDVYLAEGISEAITARLGRLGRLTVRSQAAAQRFSVRTQSLASIGRALNVGYLVTGTLRRGGEQLRITIELARATTGERVWGDQYDSPADNVLRVEQVIAEAVALAIGGRLAPGERARVSAGNLTSNPQAYDRYLRGRSAFRRRSQQAMQGAWNDFSAAIALDPSFAAARAQLAGIANIGRGRGYELGGLTGDALGALAERETLHALRLDSTLAQAWANLATLRAVRFPLTLAGTREAADRALALDSLDDQINYVAGRFYLILGDRTNGLRLLRRAGEYDPFNEVTLGALVIAYHQAGMRAEALEAADALIALSPLNRTPLANRALLRYWYADTAGARADLASIRRLPDAPQAPAVAELILRAALGDTSGLGAGVERMQAEFDRSRGTYSATTLAGLLLARGDTSAALHALEQGRPQSLEHRHLLLAPWLEGLAGQPRYQRLLASVPIPPVR